MKLCVFTKCRMINCFMKVRTKWFVGVDFVLVYYLVFPPPPFRWAEGGQIQPTF